MSNPTPAPAYAPHPYDAPVSEKIKAIQYLFDVARSAPAPAAVHEQVKTYAQFIADSLTPPAVAQEDLGSLADAVNHATGVPPPEA